MEIQEAKRIYGYMWQSGMMAFFSMLALGLILAGNSILVMGVSLIICAIIGLVKYIDCLPDNEYGNAALELSNNPKIEVVAYKIIKKWLYYCLILIVATTPIEILIYYFNT